VTEALHVETPALDPDTLRPGDGARSRLSQLLDDGSFVEGRTLNVYAQDRRVLGGSLGEAHADKIAVMGAEVAADIVFRRAIEADPRRRDEHVAGYREDAMLVDVAARRGSVDQVIRPDETCDALTAVLRSLRQARQPGFVHHNLPQ
jgi:acetyl-CoA carboxylase carboxyltransferase component